MKSDFKYVSTYTFSLIHIHSRPLRIEQQVSSLSHTCRDTESKNTSKIGLLLLLVILPMNRSLCVYKFHRLAHSHHYQTKCVRVKFNSTMLIKSIFFLIFGCVLVAAQTRQQLEQQYDGERCLRDCTSGDSRICYYHWTLEHYHTMGP